MATCQGARELYWPIILNLRPALIFLVFSFDSLETDELSLLEEVISNSSGDYDFERLVAL